MRGAQRARAALELRRGGDVAVALRALGGDPLAQRRRARRATARASAAARACCCSSSRSFLQRRVLVRALGADVLAHARRRAARSRRARRLPSDRRRALARARSRRRSRVPRVERDRALARARGLQEHVERDRRCASPGLSDLPAPSRAAASAPSASYTRTPLVSRSNARCTSHAAPSDVSYVSAVAYGVPVHGRQRSFSPRCKPYSDATSAAASVDFPASFGPTTTLRPGPNANVRSASRPKPSTRSVRSSCASSRAQLRAGERRDGVAQRRARVGVAGLGEREQIARRRGRARSARARSRRSRRRPSRRRSRSRRAAPPKRSAIRSRSTRVPGAIVPCSRTRRKSSRPYGIERRLERGEHGVLAGGVVERDVDVDQPRARELDLLHRRRGLSATVTTSAPCAPRSPNLIGSGEPGYASRGAPSRRRATAPPW